MLVGGLTDVSQYEEAAKKDEVLWPVSSCVGQQGNQGAIHAAAPKTDIALWLWV